MSEKEQIFGILCGTVEDFKAGKIIKDSMEEALIYWIWRALVQAKSNKN